MDVKKLSLVAMGAAVAAGIVYGGYTAVAGDAFRIGYMVDREFLRLVIDKPETLTRQGLIENTPLDFHSGRLDDESLAANRADFERIREARERIVAAYGGARLSAQDRLSYEVVLHMLDDFLARADFPYLIGPGSGIYPVNQLTGVQLSTVATLTQAHRIEDARSADRYVDRLRDMPRKFKGVEETVRHQAAQGVIPPVFIIDRVLEMMDAFTALDPADNPLVAGFARKLENAGIKGAERDRLLATAAEAVTASVYPAHRSLAALLRDELRPKAKTDAGAWSLPDGERFYAVALRSMTTTDMTPEQIHALGLAEVARLTEAMDARLTALGYGDGTVAERMRALSRDPRFTFGEGDAAREAVLAEVRGIIDSVKPHVGRWFHDAPDVEIEVRRVAPHAEATAASAFIQRQTRDGGKPRFMINLHDPSIWNRWNLRTLTYHEAAPGHLLEDAYSAGLQGIPETRRNGRFPAFSEGWAMYAERLMAEEGLYKDDPYGELGFLQAELFRAARLVVDTGIHARRWTREQAMTYLMETTGDDEAEVAREVERYVVNPGQATAYTIGQLKFLELRDRARAALGPKFDLRDFHRVVLGQGRLPLTLLEKQVDAWIAERSGAGA